MPFVNRQPKILILGTGIAGLSTALKFSRQLPDAEITLVCKAEAAEGSTRYAQGGIASVWSEQDSFEEHVRDTLSAGAGLCHNDIVDLCVREGPARVQELIDYGVAFTKAPAGPGAAPTDPTEVFDLHREGGHGKRRILHADDLTGWEIEKTLLERVRELPHARVLDHHIAVDLLTEGKVKRGKQPGRCLGAYVLDTRTRKIITLPADVTVLATGGTGKVYQYTSNPDVSTGDGIAMAYRAGARVADLEFMQFHPTCLYHPSARTFLITEAMRGEGAILRNCSGEEFMSRHHPMGCLAPRDVVARAIDIEMKRTGDKHVLLDCSPIGPELPKRFPNIYETCLKYGIDITRQPIPVVPAAHYMCGGVLVDENARTTVAGLYAVGEVACTGLHGANRLASNSLLEAVVFSHRAVLHAEGWIKNAPAEARKHDALPDWDTGRAVELEEQIDIAALWLEIRTLMWNYVGIVRSDRRLNKAERRIELLKGDVNDSYWKYRLTPDLIELRNLVTVADLIIRCAQLRKESRGLHYTVDYPLRDDEHFRHNTVL